MKNAYVVKGHVTSKGLIVSDESVPLPPGEVDITVQESTRPRLNTKPYTAKQRAKLKRLLKRVQNIKCPPPPDDGRSIDEVVYGYTRRKLDKNGS